MLKIDWNTVYHRLHEVFNKIYIPRLQIRNRSFATMKEYPYFLQYENSAQLFSKYLQNENFIYHTVKTGLANLWVASRGELDFDCGDVHRS